MKIGNLDISAFKVGVNDCSIYLGNVKLYPNEEPQPVGDCYSVISTPISDYTSTDYDSVFSYSDLKWYMKNNLNQYEEYGIYETASTLSELTYYDGKLAFIGETEYQYQTNEWVEVGEYIETAVTYEITEDSSALQGTEIPTTFKIPTADVESALVSNNINILPQNGGMLEIGMYNYVFYGDGMYDGTVTNDAEYYYYSLPSEAPQSIVIEYIDYYSPDTIHLIATSKQAEVEYATKDKPLTEIFNTVADMEAVGCPTVGVGQYGIVGNNAYQYGSNNQWIVDNTTKLIATYSNEKGLVVDCNTSNILTSGETQPSYLTATAMTNAVIGGCVTSIGQFAFLGCSGLISVTIGNKVTSIDNYAFFNCSGLTNVTIGNSVTSIDNYAFGNCKNLTSVTIPSSVTSIGGDAFNDTPWWASYSADTNNHYGNIIYINDVAYQATATSITSVAFKENTVSIGGGAFYYCSGLTSVSIPDSVTSIGNEAFEGCRGLTSITIPNSVTSIGFWAFQDCSSLTSVTIPNSVTSIGQSAFQYCSSLSSVTIGSGVTSIGTQAFFGCSSLTSITIPNSVISIDYRAFNRCSGLTSVTIPNSVTSIGNNAFQDCSSLTSVTIEATIPPTIGDNVFNNTNNCPIYVPSASVNAYKSATNWSTYADRIQAIP